MLVIMIILLYHFHPLTLSFITRVLVIIVNGIFGILFLVPLMFVLPDLAFLNTCAFNFLFYVNKMSQYSSVFDISGTTCSRDHSLSCWKSRRHICSSYTLFVLLFRFFFTSLPIIKSISLFIMISFIVIVLGFLCGIGCTTAACRSVWA